jgi:prefoldin subunit 5
VRRRCESFKETQTEFSEVVDEVSGLRQEMAHLQHEVEVLNLQKKDKRRCIGADHFRFKSCL